MVLKKDLSVMLVDDDHIMRAYLRIMLRDDEVTDIKEANTAAKALKFLKLKKCDLMFLDINLPDQDGVSLIQTIKQHQPECQIIMVSSEATKDRVQQAISAGAKDFIAKPFNASIVDTKVRQLITDITGE